MTELGRRPAGPTRRELVEGIERELTLAGLESAAVEARRLVAAALGLEPADVVGEGAIRVEPSEAVRVARAVGRRLQGEPLQHIEGTVDFRSLRLVSDGRALIPRPETEQLVDVVARWVKGRDRSVERALDIGTGSGVLGLSLLEECLAAHVVALDVSAEARELAAHNAAHQAAEAFEIRPCPPEIWPAIKPDETFQLVVSNPPYVTSAEWAGLEPVVRDYEPRIALDGGEDGLDVIRAIVNGVGSVLSPGGAVFLEIGANQGPEVLRLLRAESCLVNARIERDLAGRDRFAVAEKPLSGGASG